MKNLASLFSKKALQELKQQLNIVLSDEHDYSDDETIDLYYIITNNFEYEYDSEGEPLEKGKIFEEILDVFALNNLAI